MTLGKYYDNLAKIINDNINGRELVVWGARNAAFEALLFELYEIEVSFYVFWKKELCDNKTTKHMSVLENGKNKYYVINLELTLTDKNMSFLIDNDYQPNLDFILGGVSTNIVPIGKIDYYDNNGNRCNFLPKNCSVTFKGKNSEVYIDEKVSIKDELSITVYSNSKIYIKDKCVIKNAVILIHNNSEIHLENVFITKLDMISYNNASIEINKNTSIVEAFIRAVDYTQIKIGKDCMFSQKIILFAGDGHAIWDVDTKKRLNFAAQQDTEKKSIVLGEHVWIGIGSTILAGTNIGQGSIIGANSVIKKSYPNNCAVAGNPAKIIKKNIAWSRQNFDYDIKFCGENYYMQTIE